jgi:hypothetical protein
VVLLAAWAPAAESPGENADRSPAAERPSAEEPAAQPAPAVSEAKPLAEEAAEERAPRTQTALVQTLPAEPPTDFRGPDVTLIASEERTVYEYRQNGQLRMIKVVPRFGRPYYLAPRDPTQGFGDLEQARTLVPEWVIWEF